MLDIPDLLTDLAFRAGDSRLSSTQDGTRITRAVAVQHITDEARKLLTMANRTTADNFRDSTDISLVVDQQDYDLPESVEQVVRVERPDLDADNPPALRPVPFNELFKNIPTHYSEFDVVLSTHIGVYAVYSQRPMRLRLRPIPQSAITNALRVWYVPTQPELHFGTAADGAASTITFDATPTAGRVHLRDDFYNGMEIFISSGAGAMQLREITDYVGSTRIATVTPTWGTNPDSTSVYSLMPRIPESGRDALLWGVAYNLASINEIMEGVDIQRLQLHRNEARHNWLITMERAQRQAPREVIITGMWDD